MKKLIGGVGIVGLGFYLSLLLSATAASAAPDIRGCTAHLVPAGTTPDGSPVYAARIRVPVKAHHVYFIHAAPNNGQDLIITLTNSPITKTYLFARSKGPGNEVGRFYYARNGGMKVLAVFGDRPGTVAVTTAFGATMSPNSEAVRNMEKREIDK